MVLVTASNTTSCSYLYTKEITLQTSIVNVLTSSLFVPSVTWNENAPLLAPKKYNEENHKKGDRVHQLELTNYLTPSSKMFL